MWRSRLRRYALYPLQAALVLVALAAFGALPIDRASALGGWLGRTIGPRLRVTRVAERNLRRAFPERSPDDIAASIYRALGIDFRKEYQTNTGRPAVIVPEGDVIPGLLGR